MLELHLLRFVGESPHMLFSSSPLDVFVPSFFYQIFPYYVIVSRCINHSRGDILTTSQAQSCGIGDIRDALVMDQVVTTLHDAPFLAIDLVAVMAHTNNMYPLDNILEGGSLCDHQVTFHLFKQY
jgi:hypothetical protein